jgi:hypothetical protein
MPVDYHAWTHRPKEEGGTDPIPGQYPICFRAAIGEITSPSTNRVHYLSDDEGDNVYWDQWDPGFNTSVYNITPYEQTNDVDEGPVLAGVGLRKRGLYSIHAIVDLDAAFNGTSLLKSNHDEGQGEFRYHNNDAGIGEPYWGDLYGIRLDHWRVVDTPHTGAYSPDALLGGEASSVEIVLAVNTAIDIGGAIGGKVGGSPGDDMWIPGGYDGAWGFVPQLLVMYWGNRVGDTDWLVLPT